MATENALSHVAVFSQKTKPKFSFLCPLSDSVTAISVLKEAVAQGGTKVGDEHFNIKNGLIPNQVIVSPCSANIVS